MFLFLPQLLWAEVEKKISFLVHDLVDYSIKTSRCVVLLRIVWRRAGEIRSSKLSNTEALSIL